MAVTGKKEVLLAGLVIGFTLVLIHLLGIPLTGTSVNPARSIAPAVLLVEKLFLNYGYSSLPNSWRYRSSYVGKCILNTEK